MNFNIGDLVIDKYHPEWSVGKVTVLKGPHTRLEVEFVKRRDIFKFKRYRPNQTYRLELVYSV